jgi:hypothetical protein
MGEGCREGVKKREAPIVRMVAGEGLSEISPTSISSVSRDTRARAIRTRYRLHRALLPSTASAHFPNSRA